MASAESTLPTTTDPSQLVVRLELPVFCLFSWAWMLSNEMAATLTRAAPAVLRIWSRIFQLDGFAGKVLLPYARVRLQRLPQQHGGKRIKAESKDHRAGNTVYNAHPVGTES